MFIFLPWLWSIMAFYTLSIYFYDIEQLATVVCLSLLCLMLLTFDICCIRDGSFYWSYMFMYWSFVLTFVCICTLNKYNLIMSCWTFSAGAWQYIRIVKYL